MDNLTIVIDLWKYQELEVDNMSKTNEYKEYILEKLECLDSIFARPMMGGYLFYYNNILFGGIYEENRFFNQRNI